MENNKKDLQVFLVMVNYLSRFLRNLIKESSVLRNLLKSYTCWMWTNNEELYFNRLKKVVEIHRLKKLKNSKFSLLLQLVKMELRGETVNDEEIKPMILFEKWIAQEAGICIKAS